MKMPMRETPHFDNLQDSVQNLIAEAVENACTFVTEMSIDSSVAALDTDLSLSTLRQNATNMLDNMLNPDDEPEFKLPDAIVQAVNEYIHRNVGLCVVPSRVRDNKHL
jgi:hypothetical protein